MKEPAQVPALLKTEVQAIQGEQAGLSQLSAVLPRKTFTGRPLFGGAEEDGGAEQENSEQVQRPDQRILLRLRAGRSLIKTIYS
jgi:hypothetical protein